MNRPKLLDLFCGAGGAAMGYHRAGFAPYGVDSNSKPLRHYPFHYACLDALETMDMLLRGQSVPFSGEWLYLSDFAAFHASPPCQRHSTMTARWGRQEHHPNLIAPTRALLVRGLPFSIENVMGAPLLNPVMLCGSMFGCRSGEYRLRRHRLFEASVFITAPASCNHEGFALPVYGHAGGRSKRDGLTFPGTEAWREGMGIDWMTGDELAESIPPAYTEYIGKYLLAATKAIWKKDE